MGQETKNRQVLGFPYKVEVLRLESPWELIGNADSYCLSTQESHSVVRDLCFQQTAWEVLVQGTLGFASHWCKEGNFFLFPSTSPCQLPARWFDQTFYLCIVICKCCCIFPLGFLLLFLWISEVAIDLRHLIWTCSLVSFWGRLEFNLTWWLAID